MGRWAAGTSSQRPWQVIDCFRAAGCMPTVEPLSSFLTATSSPVAVSRISSATPKLPLPKSRTCMQHEDGGPDCNMRDNAWIWSLPQRCIHCSCDETHVNVARLGLHVSFAKTVTGMDSGLLLSVPTFVALLVLCCCSFAVPV